MFVLVYVDFEKSKEYRRKVNEKLVVLSLCQECAGPWSRVVNKKVRLLFSRALLYLWLGESVEREINIEHKCLGGNEHRKAYSTPGKQVSLSHLWMSK